MGTAWIFGHKPRAKLVAAVNGSAFISCVLPFFCTVLDKLCQRLLDATPAVVLQEVKKFRRSVADKSMLEIKYRKSR